MHSVTDKLTKIRTENPPLGLALWPSKAVCGKYLRAGGTVRGVGEVTSHDMIRERQFFGVFYYKGRREKVL